MAANPFAYAVTQVQKKAQQLFNPVGQAISRVPQQFGNYIQKTPQYQGAQMYQKAFQSPQVQNFGRQIAQKPIYNIPNSPTYGQVGNLAKNYATNRVIKPIVQASFDYNNPKSTNLQKGMAFAQAGMGVFNATPGGLGYNAVVQGGAGALEAFRNKTNLSKGYAKGLTNQTSLGSQGLGIKNPILAGAVDVIAGLKSFDPIPSGGFGVAALGANVKTSNRYNAPLQDALRSVRGNPDVMNPSWNKMLEFAKRELTPKELTKYQKLNSRGKLGFLNRIEQRFGNELKAFHKEQGIAYSDMKLPTQIEGLAKEASKYKSAEEFVKAQINAYHGTNKSFDKFELTEGKRTGGMGAERTVKNNAIFLSNDRNVADFFGKNRSEVQGGYNRVIEAKIPQDKILDLNKLPSDVKRKAIDLVERWTGDKHKSIPADLRSWLVDQSEFVDLVKSKGFKGVRFNEGSVLKGDRYTLKTQGGNYTTAIFDPKDILTKSQLTDIFNQSKGVQNADLSIKLPVAPQVVNGKIKMRSISAPTLETPAALSSNQELVGSGAGGGSSIKSTQEIINPQDPYFNVKRLNIDPKKQQAVKVAIEEAKPQFEAVVGKKLSNKEVVDFSNQSAKVLNKAVNREQTKQWSASMLKAREQLAISAQDDKLTPEFLDTLINVKSQGADIARKLQSLSINADPKSVTAKQAILEAVLKVTDDSAKILEAAKGVNFNDQAQATAFYRQFVKPKAEDWLTLVRYNSMLSSPNTHLVNTSSNFQGTGLVAPVEKTVLGGIDWMRSKATGTDRRYYAGEGVEYAKGYYSNLKNASENFTKVMRGESLSGNPDIRQLPLTTKKGLARTTEHVLNYPMRLLEGMDQFFSTLTQGGVERSLTYRQGKGIKVGNIESQAQQEAANRLFRGDVGGKDQGTLLRAIDQVTNLVFRARSNENPIVRTIATFTFPFVKTPMNVVKQMVEYSPAGILTLHGAKFKQEQLAKALMGAGVALGASQLLSSDRLTWAEPTNDKQRNAFRAAGLQPYAIKIGDKWISYAKLHPVIGFNLAMVASLNESFKNKKLSESEVETALTGLSKWWGYFADQSYIKNMGDLVASARGDLSGTARMLSNYPTQVIPFRALMSWVERIVDPYQRQADPNGSMLEKQLQLIGSQIPGIAGNVPTRNNLYGEPIKNQNRMINAVSPARVTTEVPDQKQIYDNMVEKSILTKQIKDIKDQAKQGKVVTGDATSTLNMGSDEVMKARFEASGDGAWNLGGKLYIKTDSGGVKVVDLQPNPTGNAIQQAKQSASNESQIKTTGVNAYFSTKLSDFDKNTIYKALGTNAQDVEFKALASLPDEKQASVLYNLLKERKWKQEKVDAFIKSDVLTSSVVGKMEDQGLINEAQAKDLKAYIKSTSIKLGKVSGSSKKAKKIKMPKLKAIKVKYSKLKIKIPKPKKYKSLLSKGRSNKYFK